MNYSNHLRSVALKIRGHIPRRNLGKTGLKIPILSMGGESILKISDREPEAIELLQTTYNIGIRYFDTAPIYHPSELRIGEALKNVRKNIIIATKTHDRTKRGSWTLLEKSLNNLKTDYIDIWQLHHIDHPDEVKTIFGPDGALSAMKEAKEQGIVKYLGITGHYDPIPLLKAIKQFDFDTILLTLNAADTHKHSFMKKLLPEAVKRNMGIIAMKACSRGRLFDPAGINKMKDALDYVFTLPISTAIVGYDNIKQLVENVQTAQDFKPLNNIQMRELEKKCEPYNNLALYFRKDYEQFNPWWKPYGYENE